MTEDLAAAHRVVVETPTSSARCRIRARPVESRTSSPAAASSARAPPGVRPATEHEISKRILGDREDVALDELQHFAAVLVEAERTWRAREAGAALHVHQPGLHDRRPRSPRPADRLAHADHAGRRTAPGERDLQHLRRAVPLRRARAPR
jgi:hypothetical protein